MLLFNIFLQNCSMKLKQYSVQLWVGSSFDSFLPQPPKRVAGYRNPDWEVGIMEGWKENKKTEYGR
jgi:hypothetical protein